MNSLIKHSKKIIIAVLLFALVITANFGLLNATINVYATEVHGFTGFTGQETVTIKNSDFSSNSSTADGYPYTPKNWTYNSTKNSDSVKHGLVNLNPTTYKNNYEKYGLGEKENPGLIGASDDNYALMINSRKNTSSSGYLSESFTLSKNGIYHVSVNLYTDDVEGAASLYLFNGDEVFASITDINAGGDWSSSAYHFLIATKDYEDLELTLGLWQGSKNTTANACVMFDEISAGKISATTLNSLIKDTGLDGVNATNYQNVCFVALESNNMLDSDSVKINASNVSMITGESSNIGNSEYSTYFFDSLSSKIVIENKKENNIAFETSEYELMPNKVYKFSVLAKTENVTSGSAFFKAVEVAESDAKNASVTFSTTTNKFNDDYTEYSIVIVSDPLKTRTIKLQFGLGTSDTQAKGKVTFEGVVVRSVPYTEFSDTDSNTKTINFCDSYDLDDIDNLVSNFAFYNSEATEVSGDNEVAINSPSDWVVSKSNSGYTQKAGVFNVKDFNYVIKDDLTNFINPGFITSINNESNNVLMLYNAMQDYLTCTSESFDLSQESYYKVSVWVNTQADGSGASITISKKDNSDFVFGSLDNINTNGEWVEYEFYVKTGYEDLEANIVLSLGDSENKARGYAYFDNCFVTTSDETAYLNAQNKFDLSNPLEYSENNKPTYFKGTSNTESNKTVSYLLNTEDLSSVLMSAEATKAKNTLKGENKNVLAIHSTSTDDYYTLTSKLNYYLKSGSYYKISVDVYTAYLKTDVENGVAGASVKLTNLENGEFVGISTSQDSWSTYTFYVNPDENVTTELVLGLGSSETICHGTALFGNIVVDTVADEETYMELTKSVDDSTKVLGTVVTDEDDNESSDDKNNEINYELIIYTLTAVAVIIAVLGVGFKKIIKPGKKRVKKTTPDYDRDSSMARQKYRKLAYIKRDKDIRKLEKELELLHADRAEKEEKYKQLLSKVREVKLANRDGKLNSELALLNKNLTKSSHNVAKIGITVNKINNEIALMKTEGYLQGLERQLMKQDEYAKSKGLSLEQMILSEDDNVTIDTDSSLDDAITKADKIIEDKKEEERLEAERAEHAKLEAEKLEQERLAQLKAEEEQKLQAEAESSNTQTESVTEQNNEVQETEKVEVQSTSENLTSEAQNDEAKQEVENAENVAEKQENEQNLDKSGENPENQEQSSTDNSN